MSISIFGGGIEDSGKFGLPADSPLLGMWVIRRRTNQSSTSNVFVDVEQGVEMSSRPDRHQGSLRRISGGTAECYELPVQHRSWARHCELPMCGACWDKVMPPCLSYFRLSRLLLNTTPAFRLFADRSSRQTDTCASYPLLPERYRPPPSYGYRDV